MVNYTLMFFVAVIIAGVIYLQIQKAALKADEAEILQNDPSRYFKFCDIIDRKLRVLRDFVKNEASLKTGVNENEILNEIANFSREITFIQTSHATNQNPKIWESKLFEFLNKIDEFLVGNFENGEEIADKFRQNLMNEFANL